LSKKEKIEQEVPSKLQTSHATVFQNITRTGIILALGPCSSLFRFEYPKNSIFSEWAEGSRVLVYFEKRALDIKVHTMEALE